MADKEIAFYNIGSAVGPGCPNKRTDVMLVQFFLHQIYSHPTKINKPIYPDGRIDRAKGEQYSFSSVSKTGYTITFLNFGHCERYRREHDRLEEHVLVPLELKTELARGEPLQR